VEKLREINAMSRGKRLNGQINGDQDVLTREETLRILSEMAWSGSISAAIALEKSAAARRQRRG
jgi:hypothetical protein